MRLLFILMLAVTVRFFVYTARRFRKNWAATQEKERIRQEKQKQNRKKQAENKARRKLNKARIAYQMKNQEFVTQLANEVIRARRRGYLMHITLLLGEMQIEYAPIARRNMLRVRYADLGHGILQGKDLPAAASALAKQLSQKYGAPAKSRGNIVYFHAVQHTGVD